MSTEPWLAHMHEISYRDGYQYEYIAGNWQEQTLIVNDEPAAHDIMRCKMTGSAILPWYL